MSAPALANASASESHAFWSDVFSLSGTTTPMVAAQAGAFGLIAAFWCLLDAWTHPDLTLEVTLMELAGAALGLLLVLRTNEGYGRWWEARKLWGVLVNQSRNLAIEAIAYGPADPRWRSPTVRWTIAFVHACRRSLRGEREYPEVARLLGDDAAEALAKAQHAPNYAATRIAALIREALDGGMPPNILLRLDAERSMLVDVIGGCERILKTPFPRVYVVQLRRFTALYLATLPLALMGRIGHWATPLVTILVAYPILGIDRIALELESPFAKERLGHLPLDEITSGIEANLLALESASGA